MGSARPDTGSAGYSGTPLVRKLGIKDGARVAFPGAPRDFAGTLGELPHGVAVLTRSRGPLDVVVFFTKARRELERRMPRLRAALDPAGALWIAWPKRASGVPTDLPVGVVRELALDNRLVDVKVAAIDATWSGLKLVIRLKDRPAG
jgi:hypothetical protein